MPSKSKTPRQVLASRHGHHRSPKLVIHQTHSFWRRRWRKYNAVPPLASSRQWNVGALGTDRILDHKSSVRTPCSPDFVHAPVHLFHRAHALAGSVAWCYR